MTTIELKKEPFLQNLTLNLDIAQLCQLMPYHNINGGSNTLSKRKSLQQLSSSEGDPEVCISIKLPPLNIFLHGEQLEFFTQLGLSMGAFGLGIAEEIEKIEGPKDKKSNEKEKKDRYSLFEGKTVCLFFFLLFFFKTSLLNFSIMTNLD